jgi:hypothetical protein
LGKKYQIQIQIQIQITSTATAITHQTFKFRRASRNTAIGAERAQLRSTVVVYKAEAETIARTIAKAIISITAEAIRAMRQDLRTEMELE